MDPNATRGKLGVFKDEAEGLTINEFVELKSKMYAYSILETAEEEKKAKGIKKHIIQRDITLANYRAALTMQHGELQRVRQVGFQTQNHQLHTTSIMKQTISPTDSKRYIIDTFNTLPYGHKNILGGPS